jgi:acyl-CoA reductase-like NAD-dependent aldehyde dehydrogenase
MQTPGWDVIEPGTGTLLHREPLLEAAEVEAALARAAEAARSPHPLPTPERLALLRRVAGRMEAHAEGLALQIAREGGKPLRDARVEVRRAIEGVQLAVQSMWALEEAPPAMGVNAASMGRVAMMTRHPQRPHLAISAFNHPLNLAVHQIIPAVAVGTPVLFKASPKTPLSGAWLLRCLHGEGLPEAWARALPVDHAMMPHVVTDPRLDSVSFIGSADVGWALRRQLAPGTRLVLELGGAAPSLVAPSADLTQVLPALVRGAFYHAGQVCVSTQRVFVWGSDARVEAVVEGLAAAADALAVGLARDEATEVGPLIRREAVETVRRKVEGALAGGARRAGARTEAGDPAWFLAPTVLVEAPADSTVMTQEIFGPVVCVCRVGSLEEAVARANALPFPFQASVFTARIDEALAAQAGLRASAVMINDHSAFRVDWQPFAGLGQAGLGEGGIPQTLRALTDVRMTLWRR